MKFTKSVDIVRVHEVTKEGTISVVIPKPIREHLGIKAGDQLLVSYDQKKNLIFKKLDGLVLS